MKSRLLAAVCAAMLLNTSLTAVAAPSVKLPDAALAPVTVAVTGDGTVVSDPPGITCPGTCTASFPRGRNVTLTATAAPDGSFLTYTGDCAGTQPSCEVLVSTPKMVNAFFDILQAAVPIPIMQTGQTECYGLAGEVIDCAGTGQDGEYQAGIAWPEPRFVDNGDGTFTDRGTGLTWLQLRNCLHHLTWFEAIDAVNNLAHGQCDLSDGSVPGQWRMPNIREALTIFDYGITIAFPRPPFTAIPGFPGTRCGSPYTDGHWTSTTRATLTAQIITAKQMLGLGKFETACALAIKGGL